MGLKSNAGQVGRVLSAAANVYLLTAGLALGLDLRDAVVFAPSGLRPAERKAVLLLEEEVEKRTQIRWPEMASCPRVAS
jgi:hypothetical protein